MINLENLTRDKIQGKRFYLTKEGLEKIKRDYENLKKIRHLMVEGETPSFFHSDDIDSEYLSFYDDLDLLETKIADLEYVLKNAQLIKLPPKHKRNTVQLGARVIVDIDGEEDEFTIVGTLEANPALGRISNESPVGKTLLGRKVGETVILSSPIKTKYKIKKIIYS